MASAQQQLADLLDQAGIGALADMVWRLHREGYDEAYIYNEITASDTYKDRFKGLISLRDQGKAAGMSEVQYLQQERAMSDILTREGLGGTDFNTPDYLASAISNQVSLDEFDTRVQLAKAATTTLPADVRQALQGMYGITQDNLLAYYLDTDKVEKDLQQQQRAASVSAAYSRFQSPAVGNAVFEDLAARGVDYQDAATAFGSLGTLGAGLNAQERLEGAFGLNRQVGLERSGRTAGFSGGGSAAAGREGIGGLGESAS